MASDSEPRKFFWRLLEAPHKSNFGKQKPVRLLLSNDSAGVEVG